MAPTADELWVLKNPEQFSAQAVWNAQQAVGKDAQYGPGLPDWHPGSTVTGPPPEASTHFPGNFPQMRDISPMPDINVPAGGGNFPDMRQDYSWTGPPDAASTYLPHQQTPNFLQIRNVGGPPPEASTYFPGNQGSSNITLTPGGGGGPTGGAVGPWTEPMRGYVQFEPGGAIYEMGDRYGDPGYIYANQHLYNPVNQMQWAEDFGTDPYYPTAENIFGTEGVGPPLNVGSLPAGYNSTPISHQVYQGVHQGPGVSGYSGIIPTFNRMMEARRIAENQRRIADALGIPYDDAGYFGDYGGGGQVYGSSPYFQQPYYSSAPPVVVDPVTGYQQQSVVTEGEPSFSQDPYPSDPFMKLPDVGMGVLPVDARNRLNTWLQGLGYDPQGVIGSYGQTDYIRPEGYEGALQFGETDYATIEDPTIRQWIQWLMGEMGYSPQITYPGAAA